MLPNFLIIGAAKSGTTSLFEQLRGHPDVFVPDPDNKEPQFFSALEQGAWHKGLAWYESLFADWNGEKAVGEASTSYSKAPAYGDAPEKIHQVLPDVKLIYVLRDPNHMVFFNGLRQSLDECILNGTFLLNVASYAMQLSHYLDRFPREQVAVFLFEDYVRNPGETARRVCRFLDVDDQVELSQKPFNTAKGRRIPRWPALQQRVPEHWRRTRVGAWLEQGMTRPIGTPRLSDAAYAHARAVLDSDVEQLRGMLGRDLEEWALERPQ